MSEGRPHFNRAPGRYLRPLALSVLIVLVLYLPALLAVDRWNRDRLVEEEKTRVVILLSQMGNALSLLLNANLSVVDGLYAYATAHPGLFERQAADARKNTDPDATEDHLRLIAEGLREGHPELRSLAVKGRDTVPWVFPAEEAAPVLPGNPPAETNGGDPEAGVVPSASKVNLSGVYETPEGLAGITASRAVVIGGEFRGAVAVVLDLGAVIANANLGEFPTEYGLVLRDGAGTAVWERGTLSASPVSAAVALPAAVWRLEAAPVDGWENAVSSESDVDRIFGIAVFLLLSLLTVLLTSRHGLLKSMVKAQTAELERVNDALAGEVRAREEAATALRRQLDRVKTILATSHDGFWSTDLEGTIVDVNDAYCRMIGYSREELLGMTVAQIEVVETAGEIRSHIEKLLEKGWDRFETRHRRKDGATIDLEISVSTGKTDEGRFIYSFLRDITERKQAERKLLLSERTLAAAERIGHVGSWVLDFERETITWSAETYRLFGYEPDEFPVTVDVVLGLVHPDDRERLGQALRLAGNSDDTYDIVYRMIRKDGVVRTMHAMAEVERDGSGRAIAMRGVTQDVTETKALEDQLRARLLEARALAELARAAVGRCSLQEFLDRSVAAVAEVLGVEFASLVEISPGAAEGRIRAGIGWRTTSLRTMPIRLEADYLAGFALASGEPVVIEDLATESRFMISNPWFNEHNVVSGLNVRIPGAEVPYGILGAYTATKKNFSSDQREFIAVAANLIGEVLTRERLYERLRETEALDAMAMEATRTGSWSWDMAADAITWSDENFRLMGREPGTVVPGIEEWLARVHPDDRDLWKEMLDDALDTLHDVDFEYRVVGPDGKVRWLRQVGRLELDDEGRPRRVYGIQTDVTRLKAAEEQIGDYAALLEKTVEKRTAELTKAHRELIEKERLASLGRVMGGISHDLRNPLGVIANSAYYLAVRLRDGGDERIAWHLDALRNSVARASEIIGELLTTSRDKPLSLAPYSLKKIVEEALTVVSLPEAIELAVEIPQDLSPLEVDARQLRRVLTNLFTNAIQAMPDGGVLSVNAEAEGDWLYIQVRDTGRGIDPEVKAHIFEPLFSTREQGVGLGLHIVQDVVRRHGGSVEATSEPGKGTAFLIRLPRWGPAGPRP